MTKVIKYYVIKEQLIKLLKEINIVDSYKPIDKEYNDARSKLLARMNDLQSLRLAPRQPNIPNQLSDSEMYNFIGVAGMTPYERYQEDLKAYAKATIEYKLRKDQIMTKYNLSDPKNRGIGYLIVMCQSELDDLEFKYNKLMDSTITMSELDEIIKSKV